MIVYFVFFAARYADRLFYREKRAVGTDSAGNVFSAGVFGSRQGVITGDPFAPRRTDR